MAYKSEVKLIVKENKELEIYAVNANKHGSFDLNFLLNQLIGTESYALRFDLSNLVSLELSNCNLTSFPEACKRFNLKHLNLSNNSLENVPTCIYNGLRSLETLDLSFNKIKNFDMQPACLAHVKTVRLNNNDFENIPKWFLLFKSTSLEEFNYSHNKSKNYDFIKNSSNVEQLQLRKLELVNSCLIDEDYSFLKSFKQLAYLDISNDGLSWINKFQDLDNLFIKPKWKDIRVLKLNKVNISIFPEGIAWMDSLKELHLTNNSLSWLPNSIEYLINLEVLDVSHNRLVSLPNKFSSLENLRVLRAAENCIECIPDLSPLTKLKTIDLFDNYLEEFHFHIDDVHSVDLESNDFNTTEIEHFESYTKKKANLRAVFSLEHRCNGPRLKREKKSSSDEESEQSEDSSEDYQCKLVSTYDIDIDEENWDLPDEVFPKHSDIDSEDDEWQGEEKCVPSLRGVSRYEKIYISEDDLLFVDVECEES